MFQFMTILPNWPRVYRGRKIAAVRAGVAAGLVAALTSLNPALAQEVAPVTAAQVLKVQDKRLAIIAERMLLANSDFCPQKMPLTGMILHGTDQYAEGTELGFSGSDVGISAILSDSPADRAGLKENDAIITIDGADVRPLPRIRDETLARDHLHALLGQRLPGKPFELEVMRDGQIHKAQITAPFGCRTLVEILAKDAISALSDGRVIQVSYGLAMIVNDEQLAVIFAHEFAHHILKHRRRLDAAGISKGMLGELGKNQRVNRQVEVEADRLSVHLLANAGYDPQIAARFWQSTVGKKAGGGMMRSWTYPSPDARSLIMTREIAQYLPLGTGPSIPGHLLARRNSQF